MIPSVSITKTDGNLGVAANTTKILAIIATALAGTANSPAQYSNKTDVVSAFTSGPLVDAAGYMLNLGIPVVLIRSTPTTAGAYGTIDTTGKTGTATVANGATTPDDDYDVIVTIVTGGALGTAGITFKYSMDGGVNYSNEQALGTSLTLTCDGGVSFTLSAAAATLLAGDTWKVTTTAPQLSSSDLTASLTALQSYDGEWLRALVLTDADATILSQLDTFAKGFHASGQYPEMITNARQRGAAEARADYQTAMATILSGVQTTEVSFSPDRCEIVSPVTGRRLRRQQAIPFAARLMLNDDSQDASAKADGSLPGVFLVTSTGLQNYADEFRFPGLDDLGMTSLRTYGGRPRTPGVFVNNPRVLSGSGSDYRYFQHSAIVNRAIEAAFSLVEPKLSMSVLLNPDGTLREDVAKSIEETVTAELRSRFSHAEPARCSDITFSLSRTDNVESTDTITFSVNVLPLGYVKKWVGKAGLVRVLSSSS